MRVLVKAYFFYFPSDTNWFCKYRNTNHISLDLVEMSHQKDYVNRFSYYVLGDSNPVGSYPANILIIRGN